jgi:hypothetical protein
MFFEYNCFFCIIYHYIFIYWYIILFLGVILVFLLRYYFYRRKKKQQVVSFFLKPLFIDNVIDVMCDVFNYAYLHNKNVIIIFGNYYSSDVPLIVILYTEFSYTTIKFFLGTSYSHFTFFVNKEGILYGMYFDYNFFSLDVLRIRNDYNLIVVHERQYNQFEINVHDKIFKNNSMKKAILLVREFLSA